MQFPFAFTTLMVLFVGFNEDVATHNAHEITEQTVLISRGMKRKEVDRVLREAGYDAMEGLISGDFGSSEWIYPRSRLWISYDVCDRVTLVRPKPSNGIFGTTPRKKEKD
jgi:hypothetical protein